MIQRLLCILILSTALVRPSFGQNTDVQEKVYVHVSHSFLLTGETLYYSAYTTSKATGLTSKISKILYIELIDQKGDPVFQKKIALNDGRGHGEYFIPSLLSTGNYQLIAYTRWMKNFKDYFRVPISIINPFEEYENPQTSNDPKVDFFPEGGHLVTGIENTVILKANNNGKPMKLRGQIVSMDGEKITDITSDQYGFARFKITPEIGKQYQAILEDPNGDFLFFKLPETKSEGIAIHLENDRNNFKLNITSKTTRQVETSITDGQNTFLAQQLTTNSPILLNKETYATGTYRVVVSDENQKILATRIFANNQEATTKTESSRAVYPPQTDVRIPLDIQRGSKLSASVRRIADYENGHISTYDARLSDNLNTIPGLHDKLSWLEMDNEMIAAQWVIKEIPETGLVPYLPEVRGEIVSGKVSADFPVDGKILTYSLSGENYQIYADELDSSGIFTLQIDPAVGNREAYLSVLDENSQAYKINLNRQFLDSYPEFSSVPISLDSLTIRKIVDRSVRNQIENIYFEPAKIIQKSPTSYKPPFGEFDYFYNLDDYNRFPEMDEHFIEFIPMVMARNNKIRTQMKVYLEDPVANALNPLILLDGVPVSQKEILNFSPYRIESIGVVDNRYFLGSLVADGVVSLHTFEKDLQGFDPGDNTIKINYQGLEPISTYQENRNGESNIPDYREQLYWNPELEVDQENFELMFTTSQTTGTFKISIEGYTENGQPVSIEKIFTVSDVQASK